MAHRKLESNDLFDGSGADAARAYVTTRNFAILLEPDLLQIGQPPVTGLVVGVADTVTVLRTFVADRALPAHGISPCAGTATRGRPRNTYGLQSQGREFNIQRP